MGMLETIRSDHTLLVTLSRPPVNAINGEWLERFHQALEGLEESQEIAVLHLRSSQKVFSAGADLKLMQSCFARADGAEAMTKHAEAMQALNRRIENLPQLTVAEIGGAALGGGLELALACDLRVASTEAMLGLPEARLGLLPGAGGTQRLTRLCGPGVARRMILGAEMVKGAQARELGLAQWAIAPQQLEAWTRDLVASLATLPAGALAASKRCLAAAEENGDRGFRLELDETRKLLGSPDTQARVRQFLDMRSPKDG